MGICRSSVLERYDAPAAAEHGYWQNIHAESLPTLYALVMPYLASSSRYLFNQQDRDKLLSARIIISVFWQLNGYELPAQNKM